VLKIEPSCQMYEEHSRIELVYTRTFQQNVKKLLECVRAKYSYKWKYLELLDMLFHQPLCLLDFSRTIVK